MIRHFHVGLLLVCATMLVLFFATGMYHEKIVRAYKCAQCAELDSPRRFVPQANRALRSFNVSLSTPRPWFSYLRGASSASSGLSRSSSGRALIHRSASFRSVPTVPRKSPSKGRAGELLFSQRVDPVFRDGYEAFRSNWIANRAKS